MRRFRCRCGNLLYFENTRCLVCGAQLGFVPEDLYLHALEPGDDGWWVDGRRYRQCLHYSRDAVCNWMVPADDPEPFCTACRLNAIIPDLSLPENQANWARLEAAKRYLLYEIARLGLPLIGRHEDPGGLGFAFMADDDNQQVLTGHAGGLITINVREADDAYREGMRKRMGEGYRTLLGHFRHESGHYYWQQLIADSPHLEEFRTLFGDERNDYADAIARHYATPRADWQNAHISAYATAHPWEDWAETWGHYLLMRDTLETAEDYGLHRSAADPDFTAICDAWRELSLILNGLGQSLGMPTLYPFVLNPPVVAKLRFVHETIVEAAHAQRPRD